MSLLSDDPYSILQSDFSSQTVPADTPGVRALYWLGMLLWLAILLAIGAFPNTFFEYLIVLGVIGIFILGVGTAGKIDWYTESFVFKNNFYQGILISFFPLLIYSLNRLHTNRKFLRMALTAMTLSLLTLLDVWVTPEYIWVLKTLRTVFQTMAIGLIMLSLVQLYYDLIVQTSGSEGANTSGTIKPFIDTDNPTNKGGNASTDNERKVAALAAAIIASLGSNGN